ncbi:MAG: 3-deoxy-D-manno-octulosonic acid transferase [Bacteroidales bacterium]|nr:3-deoxy-D-manno-octulosonic acid transferase [Bacteroidales bacterium]
MRRLLETSLYSSGIAIYRFGIRVASACGHKKARLLNRGQRDIYGRIEASLMPGDRVIWVHAASLGEFEQGRPLMERIRRELPHYKILLTFFSPSGFEVRKNYEGADCVCYLPFDTPGRVKRFIERVNPEMAIFVKYEIWRNYLYQLNRRDIPSYLISAVFRPEQLFFRHPKSWYTDWLRWYKHIFVQDEGSRRLLEGVGIKNVDVCGDTRFDRVSEIRHQQKKIPELETFNAFPGREMTIMAGSSWPADEEIYIDWINAHPHVKLVVAPHEFDAKRLETLRVRFKNGAVLISEVRKDDSLLEKKNPQVIIMDCFGLLSSAYSYCDVAYVGGGFGAGLHNINEAAVYEVPVIYGPNNHKFIEARELRELGGGHEVKSREDFESIAERLLDAETREKSGKAAGAYIRSKLGATDKIFESIMK